MKVEITYCMKWNYKPRASRLGELLKDKFNADVELIGGSGGVYEVVVDGKTIFSKASAGRFPEDTEILEAIQSIS